MKTTQAERDEARRLDKKAAPGPWTPIRHSNSLVGIRNAAAPDDDIAQVVQPSGREEQMRNAHFIAHARTFAPKAASDVDKLLGLLGEALDAPGHDANDHNCEDWPPGTGCRGCAGDATRKRLRAILTEQEGK